MTQLTRLGKGALGYTKLAHQHEVDIRIFPCVKAGKKPAVRSWTKEASLDPDAVQTWWGDMPDANIGMVAGKGLIVLDVDGEEGAQSLDALLLEHGSLPRTWEQTTGKGRHFVFRVPSGREGKQGASQLAPGLDTRAEGKGYIIVAPSVHPNGGRYTWVNKPTKTDIAVCPDWLLDLLEEPKESISDMARVDSREAMRPTGTQSVDNFVQAAFDQEIQLLSSQAKGGRNDQLNHSAFNLGQLVGAGVLGEGEVRRALAQACIANGMTQEDGPAQTEKTLTSGLRAGIAKPRDLSHVGHHQRSMVPTGDNVRQLDDYRENAPVPRGESQWLDGQQPAMEEFARLKNGGLNSKSINNYVLYLKFSRNLNGLFRFNEFSNKVDLVRSPPWEDPFPDYPRSIRDTDLTRLKRFFETLVDGMTGAKQSIQDAVDLAAEDNKYNPVRDRLNELEWDGTPRLERWLIDYLDCEDTPYVREISARWMIGAVNRVFVPGCKMDYMLVLEGAQGAGKSTILHDLADAIAPNLFTDTLSDVTKKDAFEEMEGKLIVEMAELAGLRRAEAETIKRFITSQSNYYRGAYKRIAEERPRTCVFAGTVNPGSAPWLRDETGGRRFWPVVCPGEYVLNRAEFILNREQIWAEAVFRFKAGDQPFISDPDILEEAMAQQSERQGDHEWEQPIAEWIGAQSTTALKSVTATHLALNALDMRKVELTKGKLGQIGKIMRDMGWEPRRRKQSGARWTEYMNPEYRDLWEDDDEL